jgi:short-subunit dehydrogenase
VELRQSGVTAEVLVADLSIAERRLAVEHRLADPSRPIDVLVNNAGFSINQKFVGGDLEREQLLLDVMVVAVMRLTHAAIPGMRGRRRGLIVNISSMAGFLPFGTYSAAKSWVTSFTQGLATELAGSGVSAIAVCPGFVHTEFHSRAGVDMSRAPEQIWLTPEEVVSQAMKDVQRDKVLSIAGTRYRALSAATHLMPRDAVRRLERYRRRRLGR